ncbi:Cytochrome b subunit of the bc complex [Halanaeroarchaeum sp. HSR-CO]|uniref:cytochrome b n=1 Tax=Halanaeroarchaeum sp. HSR-CO TaxID=2866382 RepID=UPI00217CCF7D|nr:cytochrome bc complex cytochrome b subunit [Halanaeroarchaeum sp. HSR-CO]UWG48235.1 Cytochrome b subunit of the bc complex [Halanaeroarchaeum sp. HSR-CO]
MADGGDSRLDLDRLFGHFERKVFPLHGTFLLGELALFSFTGIVATGIFLGLFYEPSTTTVTVNGEELPAAYASVLQLNGLAIGQLVRRIHHWSAHIMLATLVVHMARVYVTGAYREPRDINWLIGTGLLGLTVLAAFVGYLLPFDQFAVTATAIGYQIATSVPWVGQDLANLVFAGPFPNPQTVPRFYTLHILLIPAALVGLISVHLLLILKIKHTQDPGITGRLKQQAGSVKKGLVGIPMWPEQVVVMIGVFFAYATGVTLLAAFVPVHPIEVYGPPGGSTPAVKPDWYLLWVYGILRVMPPVDVTIFGGTIGARFLAGVVVPGVVGGAIASVPIVDKLVTGSEVDDRDYTSIEHPFDRPGRTAIGIGAAAFFVVTAVAGYYTELGIPGNTMRALIVFVPPAVGLVAYLGIKERFATRTPETPSTVEEEH